MTKVYGNLSVTGQIQNSNLDSKLNNKAERNHSHGEYLKSGSTAGTLYVNDWFRANGNTGIYFQTHGGGWHMSDSTWLRAFGNKSIYTAGIMKGDGGFASGNLKLTAASSNGNVKIQSQHGYVNIGPQNTGHCHYETDRPNHWFNKEVKVNGEIYAGASYSQKVYHQGFKPSATDILFKDGDSIQAKFDAGKLGGGSGGAGGVYLSAKGGNTLSTPMFYDLEPGTYFTTEERLIRNIVGSNSLIDGGLEEMRKYNLIRVEIVTADAPGGDTVREIRLSLFGIEGNIKAFYGVSRNGAMRPKFKEITYNPPKNEPGSNRNSYVYNNVKYIDLVNTCEALDEAHVTQATRFNGNVSWPVPEQYVKNLDPYDIVIITFKVRGSGTRRITYIGICDSIGYGSYALETMNLSYHEFRDGALEYPNPHYPSQPDPYSETEGEYILDKPTLREENERLTSELENMKEELASIKAHLNI